MTQTNANKRLAKNTIMLYIRMIVMMVVTLYTTRVILDVLGVEDFGLYNVISGAVVLFSFVNTALISATQRFLNFEIGKDNKDQAQKIFAFSILLNIIIALCVLVVGEPVGLWYIHNKLVVPIGRETSAIWTFHLALFATCTLLLRTPYNAVIIAYEKMSFYAYISVIEAFLKLAIIFPLVYITYDKLICYSILIFTISAIITLAYLLYCIHSFPVCKFSLIWDKRLFKEMTSFSGWSILGTFSDVGSIYGLNLILNSFLTVTGNAAFGIAMQVVNAINMLAGNFQMAFRPQIIKLYAQEETDSFNRLVFMTSRFSYFLLLLVAVPFTFGSTKIFELWLGTPPPMAIEFSTILLWCIMIDAVSAPLWMAAQAAGNIRNYQIIISTSILSIIPIAYIMLKMGISPTWVIFAKVIVTSLNHIIRMLYLKRRIEFPIKDYTRKVLFPIASLTLLVFSATFLSSLIINDLKYSQFIVMVVGFCITIITIYILGITKEERQFFIITISSKVHHN